MMEAIIFNLIKVRNSCVDLCLIITLSSDNVGAAHIAGFWAASVMFSWDRGAVRTKCLGDSMDLSQGLHLLVGWRWRAGGGFHVAVLDYSGLELIPPLLVGPSPVLETRWRCKRGKSCSRPTQTSVGGRCVNTGAALTSSSYGCEVPVSCLA